MKTGAWKIPGCTKTRLVSARNVQPDARAADRAKTHSQTKTPDRPMKSARTKTTRKTEGFRYAKPTIKKLRKQYLCLSLCLGLRDSVSVITETETESLLLVALTNKKVSLSWFFFLGMKSLSRSSKPDFAVFNAFSTKFYTFGKIGGFDHASSLRKPR